jgi:DNA-binding transcriptional ArsR family regulator
MELKSKEVIAPEADQPLCGMEEHQRRRRDDTAAHRRALERAASIFRAAGEAGRLVLLEQLLEGERCVTDLAATAGVGLSTVSQQLRVLREEDLVVTRREGKHIYYALADQHVVDLIFSVMEHAREGDDARHR